MNDRAPRLVRIASMLALSACGGASTTPRTVPAAFPAADAPQAAPSTGDAEALRARDDAAQARLAIVAEAEAQRAQDAGQTQRAEADSARDRAARMDAAWQAEQQTRASQLERDLAEQQRFVERVLAARVGTLDAPTTDTPPLCADRTDLEALRTIAQSGESASDDAAELVAVLDPYCARFERWTHPDEDARRALDAYVAHLARLEGWMRDLERCVDAAGTEQARCRHATSDIERAAGDEASRILSLLAAHRAELAGIMTDEVRFPCTTPTLGRIDADLTWAGSVARAQMPQLPRRAEQVCEALGVHGPQLREARRALGRALDHAESQGRARMRQLTEARDQLGAQALPPPAAR